MIKHYIMHDPMNFIGQRADLMTVTGIMEDDGTFRKVVDHYTATCDVCENGVGNYDERGDIICDTCGAMLCGEPVIPTEFGETREDEDGGGAGDEMESSRGLGQVETPPIPDPAPQPYDDRDN